MAVVVLDALATIAYLRGEPGKEPPGGCFALTFKRKHNAELFTADHHEFDAVVASGESGIVFIR